MSESPPLKSRAYRVPFALLLGLTLLSGVVHGVLDGRWSEKANEIQIGELLEQLPSQSGDWKLVEEQQLDDSAVKILRCYGSLTRIYQNTTTNEFVNVTVLYGPRGPTAVHTPEVCYPSVGTKQARETHLETISIPSGQHEFWSVQFGDAGDPTPNVDVWYAWSTGGKWIAGKHPRFWLTENLYKIQVGAAIAGDSPSPIASFLTDLLPDLQKQLR